MAAPPGTPKVGRPPKIDRERIVAVAAAMDPETLTMAAVAQALGVSHSALYRWVGDREALLDLVSEQMAARLLPDWAPTASSWRAWLTEWAQRVRTEFGAVPGYGLRVLTGPHRDAGHGPLEAGATSAFRAGGATAEQARQLWYVFSTAVVAWVTVEQGARFPHRGARMDFDTLLGVLLGGVDASIGSGRDTAGPPPTG